MSGAKLIPPRSKDVATFLENALYISAGPSAIECDTLNIKHSNRLRA